MATFTSHVLYVGNLSWWITDADIRRIFDQFGNIIEVESKCPYPVFPEHSQNTFNLLKSAQCAQHLMFPEHSH
jgi:RNA recognition motif-containing protein